MGKELLRRVETHFIGTGPKEQWCQSVEKMVTQGTLTVLPDAGEAVSALWDVYYLRTFPGHLGSSIQVRSGLENSWPYLLSPSSPPSLSSGQPPCLSSSVVTIWVKSKEAEA